MTDGELRFYKFLQYTVGQKYSVFAQVRLASVVTIPEKFFLWKSFNPLGAKCVDFVLYDKNTGVTMLVIELDDKSHERRERKERDAFVNKVLAQAGVPILHIKPQYRYDQGELLENIAHAIK